MKRAWQAVALLLLAMATIRALRIAVIEPLACEANVTRALRVLDAAAERSDTARLMAANDADALLRGCERYPVLDFKVSYARGTVHRYRGEAGLAIHAYRRALALDRRPEIYIALGIAQLAALDRSRAIDSFIAAGTFDPASLKQIPYEEVRGEVRARIRELHGDAWLP